jgi:hypothetical protein
MWCRNLLELPLEVLVIILAFLRGDHLRMARVVCRAFRAASIQCVTTLGFCGPNTSWKIINERLQVFNSVKCLDLTIRRARQASLLQRPAILSRLRELRLTCRRPDAIIPLLAAASQLTKLEVEVDRDLWLHDRQFPGQLDRALGGFRCSAVVTLRLTDGGQVPGYKSFKGIDNTPISHLIVCGIHLRDVNDRHVPLTHFSRLECLELVNVEPDQVEAVAALTQLTRLGLALATSGHIRTELMPLSQLTALQELKVANFDTLCMQNFQSAVSPMVRLRELELKPVNHCWYLDLAEIDCLLAALPAVTSLVLHNSVKWRYMHSSWGGKIELCNTRPPRVFASNGFAGLRKLCISIEGSAEHVARLATVLPQLEALTFVGDCQSLLSNLPPMPRLTELTAVHYDTPCVSGHVLARFQGLQHLRLVRVLDDRQWNEDVKSLAVLTHLKVLEIKGHYHSPNDVRWHVTIEELMLLTALRQLHVLELYPVSASGACVTEFWEAMKAIRHEMGFSSSVAPSHKRSHLIFVL